MIYHKYRKIYFLSTLVILSLSILAPGIAFAAPLADTAEDWQYVNGNSWAQNFSPQTQITKDNIDALEVKWIFPVSTAGAPAAFQSLNLMDGSTTPPIVANGKVFFATQYQRTYAVDAKTGALEWTHEYSIDVDAVKERNPFISFGGIIGPIGLWSHLHGFRYWESGNQILMSGIACDFYGIDADTGETTFWYQDLCKDIEGNAYAYRQGSVSQTNIGTYDRGRQFIFVLPGAMHSQTYVGDFRHTTIGVNMDTGEIEWRVFSFPAHQIPNKDWALQECDIGFFQDIPCSEVAASAIENLEWDWAEVGEPPSVYGGVTANWGQIVVDEDTGIIYTQTGNQGPYTYIGATPGPRLYGSTIMAIDANAGQRIWWMQPFPRDPYDYDCNWSGVLADHPTLGMIYMKGCKEGFLNILDAETGEPIHRIDVAEDQYDIGQITIAGTLEPNDGGIKYHLNDPFSYYDMREMVSPENSNYCGAPCPVYPNFFNGIFATDMSYNPETGILYHYAAALQTWIVESPPASPDASVSITRGFPTTNTSIIARDVETGDIKWTWYFDPGQNRAHMVISPELLATGWIDGFMRFFDPDTGELLREMNTGSILNIGITTGQDSDGNQLFFTMAGITSAFGGSESPGILVAFGLSERAAEEARTVTSTTTVTSTSRTTLTTTSTSVSTSVSTTATTSTVTSTAQASTTTVTSEITEETGLPAEITYAAIAVAVIAIIAAAFLMMRKR